VFTANVRNGGNRDAPDYRLRIPFNAEEWDYLAGFPLAFTDGVAPAVGDILTYEQDSVNLRLENLAVDESRQVEWSMRLK